MDIRVTLTAPPGGRADAIITADGVDIGPVSLERKGASFYATGEWAAVEVYNWTNGLEDSRAAIEKIERTVTAAARKGQRREGGASVHVGVRMDRVMLGDIEEAVKADHGIEDKSAYIRWVLGLALLAREVGEVREVGEPVPECEG